MVAFIHGIQLENKLMRGGFENLSLIVLADAAFGVFFNSKSRIPISGD